MVDPALSILFARRSILWRLCKNNCWLFWTTFKPIRFQIILFTDWLWLTHGWKFKFHVIAHARTIKKATYRNKALLTMLNVAKEILQRSKKYFMIHKIAHNFSFDCSSVVIAPLRRYWIFQMSCLHLFQIRGVQDLFVFDHGSFFADSNSSLGNDTAPGEYSLRSLHVQDRGVFELHSSKKDTASVLSLYNLTVRSFCMTLLSP